MTKKGDSKKHGHANEKHGTQAIPDGFPGTGDEGGDASPAGEPDACEAIVIETGEVPPVEPAAPVLEPAPEPTAALPAESQQLLRLRADFENYRKRVLREKDELYQRANMDLLGELLPVLDNLDMAFAAVQGGGNDAVVQGFKLVGEQMLGVMARFGLKPVDAEGQAFDHRVHEAIAHLPSAEVAENHVIAQTRRGYMLGERLLRPAQVVVSSGPPAA